MLCFISLKASESLREKMYMVYPYVECAYETSVANAREDRGTLFNKIVSRTFSSTLNLINEIVYSRSMQIRDIFSSIVVLSTLNYKSFI